MLAAIPEVDVEMVDGVPIPRQVAYWVRKYVRYWQTHLRTIRRRFGHYSTFLRSDLTPRMDDTSGGWRRRGASIRDTKRKFSHANRY